MLSQPDNPDGFYENVKFVELNERLLSDAGGAGNHLPPRLPSDSANWNREVGGVFHRMPLRDVAH